MLICQEMFLLLTKDNGKKEDWVANNEAALRATVLADLLLGEHIELSGKKKVETTAQRPGHPVLAWAWEELQQHKVTSMKNLLEASWFTPREIIALDFHANGQLDVEKAKWWQLSGDRYIMTDLELEKELRERLVAVLEAQRPAEVNDVIILDILREVSGAYTLLKNDADGMKRREMRARIQEIKKEVEYDNAASSAVKAVVEEAAALAAVVATSAAITTT
ncbi:GPP34 family phosphoprotein [Corynebacterium sp. c8Ua_181]|uniref:GPP34 family phosphoprotein n=1 Tax=Corynebacterium curieae TaxID=2913500 RepID=A0A9X3RT85_9CORY|nr:GPP34 family phosphoprotein [Corynebacterium curieae]MCZ9306832.1 GPP34 family phosphoprotein [Corynebacterium curieae]MDV2423681.1 GPP34 family phosphoprotein [Corynebacterium curieae]